MPGEIDREAIFVVIRDSRARRKLLCVFLPPASIECIREQSRLLGPSQLFPSKHPPTDDDAEITRNRCDEYLNASFIFQNRSGILRSGMV